MLVQSVQLCCPLPASAKATKLPPFLCSSQFFLPPTSLTAKKEKAWRLSFSCLLCTTDPLLLDVKIYALLVHPYKLQLTMLVNS